MPRPLSLTLGMLMVFAVTILILANVLPGPHRPTDYLVMGGVATMLCLVLLFVLLAVTPRRKPSAPGSDKPGDDQTDSHVE
jgi:Na+/melibiose symporter-like transporter